MASMTQSGTLVDHQFYSGALNRHMRLHVYLPPRFPDYGGRYPTVYLLHPWGKTERFWTDALDLPEVADRLIDSWAVSPFIAVMPQGDKSFFIDAADPAGDFNMIAQMDPDYFEGALDGYGDYADYLLNDVVRFVERSYPVRTDRDGRAIGGISMGGTGAAILGMSMPDAFSAVGIHSPLLYCESCHAPPWIFGLADQAAFEARDPLHLAQKLHPKLAPRIGLDCGLEDERSSLTADLHYALVENGIPHHYHSHPGDYSVDYWRAHLPEYLGFYAAEW
ncbi:MAG: esterase family protein [Chloroflexi bacterium]|nr:esterase family protein [Chloroflexota bacterium]